MREPAQSASCAIHAQDREATFKAIAESPDFDAVIIGAGATGLGIAVDAASRGYRVLALDAQDFCAGTSSRSTKLIHGGLRYMKSPAEWPMVKSALAEQQILLRNAPALVHPQAFVLPAYSLAALPFYGAGVAMYSSLFAGGLGLARMRTLGRLATMAELPGVRRKGLKGSIKFWDAQFDDARMGIALLHTALSLGALALNYCPVKELTQGKNGIQSATIVDEESGRSFTVSASVFFNCAGPWVDTVRRLADPACDDLIAVSRGSHILVDASHLPSTSAMVIPKTSDGRILFCIPWHGMLEIGTTDIEQKQVPFETEATEDEIAFLLMTANRYLQHPLEKKDVRAAFAGLRPLVKPRGRGRTSSRISREHEIFAEFGNLLSVTGGKWTSYRLMAEDALARAIRMQLLPPKNGCQTRNLPLAVDLTMDPAQLEQDAVKCADLDSVRSRVRAYARHCALTNGARRPEDVLTRRLRVGQMHAERAAALQADALAGIQEALGAAS
ncbi:MAG TPA: glycerol-3-phosphate dehydrogenase [Sutterella sp.]|nr:glycerol-3-phosphate dehydrogenase [Sutterella sp.]